MHEVTIAFVIAFLAIIGMFIAIAVGLKVAAWILGIR